MFTSPLQSPKKNSLIIYSSSIRNHQNVFFRYPWYPHGTPMVPPWYPHLAIRHPSAPPKPCPRAKRRGSGCAGGSGCRCAAGRVARAGAGRARGGSGSGGSTSTRLRALAFHGTWDHGMPNEDKTSPNHGSFMTSWLFHGFFSGSRSWLYEIEWSNFIKTMGEYLRVFEQQKMAVLAPKCRNDGSSMCGDYFTPLKC